MKIVVMATGGVGGYYGARLAAAGEDVHFIARGAHLAAMRSNGLKLVSANGDLHLRPVSATDDPETIGKADIVLFAVKQYDTEAAARIIRPLVADKTAVLTVQNGVDPQERLQAIVGRDHVMGGTTYIIGAKVAAPGIITHVGTMERLVFGEFDGNKTERAQQFLAACTKAAINGALSLDIAKDIWAKFALLSAFSGVTSMTRQAIGAIMSDPDRRNLLGDAIAETAMVAEAKGINLGGDYVEKHRNFYASVSPETKSSMLMDLESGRRLELEWLSGAVAQLGDQLGVPTPIHHKIYAALKPYAHGRD